MQREKRGHFLSIFAISVGISKDCCMLDDLETSDNGL